MRLVVFVGAGADAGAGTGADADTDTGTDTDTDTGTDTGTDTDADTGADADAGAETAAEDGGRGLSRSSDFSPGPRLSTRCGVEESHPARGRSAETRSSGSLMVIGNFDGVHRGHQAVLREAAADARTRGLELIILTFYPHPAKVLRRTEPPVLTVLPRKLELIERVVPGAGVAVERFDLAWAAQSPAEFAERILAGRFEARVVVVGKNFRFGKDRAGDFEDLTRLGGRLGFETRSHPMVGDERGPWSSSRVREAIARGEVEDAARILGRPHMLSGVVEEGDKRGRTIGFPTCNLPRVPQAMPANGVYAVLLDRVEEGGRASVLGRGVANIGVRPTVKEGEKAPLVEVHLFDFGGDLYGSELRVHVISRIREERRFSGLAELKEQIGRDAREARERLAHAAPDPAALGAWS
ncbi:MAG: bifunctional riboflavin kinase/FAD synthetase [Polyangiaceae bacterium]|nr:bifunctional riboflavin kinase/FAD synthetase [Polyangiaceae bacterium]